MTTAISRAANAIANLGGELKYIPYRDIARAALAATREPTPEMIAAAWRVLNPCGKNCIEQYGLGPAVREAWHAMHDAMMAEGKEFME